MLISLVSLFMFMCVYYFFSIRRITPISILIFFIILYSMGPVVFDKLEYSYYDNVVMIYKSYDDSIYPQVVSGVFFICSILFFLDLLFMSCTNKLYSSVLSLKKNKYPYKKSLSVFYFLFSISFLIVSLFGVYVFGVDRFLHGYSDASMSMADEMNHSPGWSLYSNGGIFFYMLSVCFYLTVTKKQRALKFAHMFLLLMFVSLNLISGARLITLVGLISIFFSQCGLVVHVTKKFILFGFLGAALFLSIGIYRGGGDVGLLYAFLEYPFVGFGLYNIVNIKDGFDIYPIEMLADILTFMAPAYFFDKSHVYRYDIIRNYFPDNAYISPIGGNFYLTDLYLYCGYFSFFVVAAMFFVPTMLSMLLCRIEKNGYFVIMYSALTWVLTFGLFWLLRNQLIVSASMLSKIVYMTIFLLLFLRFMHLLTRGRPQLMEVE